MALNDRSMGYELSNVEREIACNPKYENVGYVRHDKADGYFYLDYSPYKRNDREEIYYSYGPRPPEGVCAEVRVEEEKYHFFDYFDDRWVKIKNISAWREFDVSEIASQRKIMDFREIIEFFTYPYRGESDEVLRIALCSCLFACSSPPVKKETGGISSAIFGRKYQWDLFTQPLDVIPREFRKLESEIYYHISPKEKEIKKNSGEINRTALMPENLVYDIPVVVDNVSIRKFRKDYREGLDDEASIITSQILDSILIHPSNLQKFEDIIEENAYEMREAYLSAENENYRQNFADALPKLASSYARLHCSPEINKEDIRMVMDLWSEMHEEVCSKYDTPKKVRHAFLFVGETRRIYNCLYRAYGSSDRFPISEGIKVCNADPDDYMIAIDSLEGMYLERSADMIRLKDP